MEVASRQVAFVNRELEKQKQKRSLKINGEMALLA
jgi:hypothetical protein